jgi:hypothetical protein
MVLYVMEMPKVVLSVTLNRIKENIMENDELYEEAVNAITNLFSDRSVSASTTVMNLNDLIGEIQIMLDCLDMNEDEQA